MHTGWSAASTWRSCSNWKMTWRMTWTQWGYSLSVVRCCDIGALHNYVIFFCNQSSSLCWIQCEVNVISVKLNDGELTSGFAVSAAGSPACFRMFQRLWGPWSDDEEREQAEFCAPGGVFCHSSFAMLSWLYPQKKQHWWLKPQATIWYNYIQHLTTFRV